MLIAVTDLETTGLDPKIHEIIDIGLLVVDSKKLEIIDRLDMATLTVTKRFIL